MSRRYVQEHVKLLYKNSAGVGMSYSDVRKIYIEELLLPLIKKGYRGEEIAEIFGLKPYAGTNTISKWCKELFNDKTMHITKARKVFLPQVIRGLIRRGYLTYEDIASQFEAPSISARAVEYYIFQVMKTSITEAKVKIYKRFNAIRLLKEGIDSRTEILLKLGVAKSTAEKSGRREWAYIFDGISFEDVRMQIKTGYIGGISISEWLSEI